LNNNYEEIIDEKESIIATLNSHIKISKKALEKQSESFSHSFENVKGSNEELNVLHQRILQKEIDLKKSMSLMNEMNVKLKDLADDNAILYKKYTDVLQHLEIAKINKSNTIEHSSKSIDQSKKSLEL